MKLETKPGFAFLLFFAVVAACIISYVFFDIPAARFCASIGPGIKSIFNLITRLGLSTPYEIATAAAFVYFQFVKRNRVAANAAVFLFVAVSLSGVANDLIKVLVGRSRPDLLLHQGVYGFVRFTGQYSYASFPSGHADTIAALCYGLYIIASRLKFILAGVALAVMASRVIVGAHFPSDVLFGAYLGFVVTHYLGLAFEKRGVPIAFR
jgi:membrane-associated phospholipid phosphatase